MGNELDKNLTLNKKTLKQGEILIIKTDVSSPFTKITFDDRTYDFRITNETKISLIPISYWTNPGQYTLTFISPDRTFNKSITVSSGNFVSSYLEVDKEQEQKLEPEDEKTIQKKKEDQQLINEARSSSSSQKIWDDNFIWPVKGEISTEFGATRYVNGKLQNRHSGIDIASQNGTSIKATNSGIVTLAHNLLITGNTIIIDHGWNVYSAYSHLSKINVVNGEKVKKGQKIGEIGSTGFSTGPHLHWTIKINSVYVNPKVIVNNKNLNLQ
ncbi:MAG: M23 family metallopeptidase [Halanaerobiales bacterium]|nr:M23 family metallopeptidase [Halanaerobiales bacterium]